MCFLSLPLQNLNPLLKQLKNRFLLRWGTKQIVGIQCSADISRTMAGWATQVWRYWRWVNECLYRAQRHFIISRSSLACKFTNFLCAFTSHLALLQMKYWIVIETLSSFTIYSSVTRYQLSYFFICLSIEQEKKYRKSFLRTVAERREKQNLHRLIHNPIFLLAAKRNS